MSKISLKIISLVPSLTELLIDLGLEKNVVGITKFCIHPKGLRKSKTIVGGTKNIQLEKIKNLQPNIILCNKEENTKEIVAQCQKIAQTHVSDIVTLQDALELIELYGKLFSCKEKATEIVLQIKSEKENFKSFIKEQSTLKVAYFIWKSPWMVAANNTFINHLLQLNKFENVYQQINRYPEIDVDKLANTKPDLVLLSSEPYPFKEKHVSLLKEKLPNTKIILVDGEFFSWYGSRLLYAFQYFTNLRKRIGNFSI